MFSRLLSISRKTILIPVLGAWIAALCSLGFGMYEVLLTIISLFSPAVEPDRVVKLSVINLVEAVDLFLLGTAFYIISLGMYELFVDENVPVPGWLEIHNLDDLKNKLISVIVVVLGVQFLAQVLNWKGDAALLPYGAAISLVILALGFFIGQMHKSHKE